MKNDPTFSMLDMTNKLFNAILEPKRDRLPMALAVDDHNKYYMDSDSYKKFDTSEYTDKEIEKLFNRLPNTKEPVT